MSSNAILIEIEKIRRDGGTQSRVRLDESTVADYAAAMEAGATFPPVVVYYDGTTYWLADGFHRIAAWLGRGVDAVAADVLQGTQRDAILHSVGVNATHGLRRTNEDKRRAVEVMLRDDEWREWSDRKIADRAGVDHKTVGRIRGELFAAGEIPQPSGRFTLGHVGSFLMTDPSYPVTPSENAEVEAARQKAIGILSAYDTAEALKDALKGRQGGHVKDSVRYQMGVGYLSDGQGSSQSVTAKQIGVAMTTPNGTGVFRFDAFQLWQWVQERAVLLKDATVFRTLVTIVDRDGSAYIDPKVAKNLAKYGLASLNGSSYVTATAVTRQIVEDGLKDYPLLRMLIAVKRETDGLSDIDSGMETLVEIYSRQSAEKRWVLSLEFWRWKASEWLAAFAARGLVYVETRSAVDKAEDHYSFYAVTEHVCKLMGKKPLAEPEPLPDLPYNRRAKVFVPPDAEFQFKVGDLVTWGRRPNPLVVTGLGPWPYVGLSEQGSRWTPEVSQFELALFAGGAEAAEKLAEANEHKKIDDRTDDLLAQLFSFGVDLAHYPDKELVEQLQINLRVMQELLVNSPSGQRMGLRLDDEYEDDEDGALSGGGSEDIDESEHDE